MQRKVDFWSVTGDTSWFDLWNSDVSGGVLLSGYFGTLFEMSEFNLERELSFSAGVSVTIWHFGADLSKLVNVFEDIMLCSSSVF